MKIPAGASASPAQTSLPDDSTGARLKTGRLANALDGRAVRSILFCIVLTCLLLGLACRFYGLNWDEGAQLHPDERFCASVVERIGFPHSLAEYFDSRVSPLNPANLKDTHYIYGQLPLFLLKIAAQITGRNMGTQLWVLGRFLSALFDCGTVLFTYLIARRLLSRDAALFAAALISCAALHIQQSHFFVTDPFATFFTTAAFWAGAKLVEKGRARDALWLGALFGAALACKISALLFGAALLGFLLVFARNYGARRAISGTILVILATGLVFRVGQPMAFRGEFGFFDVRPTWKSPAQIERDGRAGRPEEPPVTRFWNDVALQGGITNGTVDVPFNVQWIGRKPLLFSLRNLGFWAYGWPFLLSAGFGLLVLTRRARGHVSLIVGAFFALTLLGIQGAAFSKFTRYFLPMTPFCALLAAFCWQKLGDKRAVLRLGAPAVALFTATWALAVTSIYGRTHPRIAASRWIENNIAAGAVVGNETAWDEGLPLGNIGVTNTLNSLDFDVTGLDSPQKTAVLEAKLDAVQWIFVSSGRQWQNIPRWNDKWPVTTEYYRALFDGRLGFELAARFDSFPRLGPWQFPDASAEEALTVYDHPLVLLFRKTRGYDPARVREILEAAAPPQNGNWQPRLAPAPEEKTLPVPPGY